ncbi:hypothetical protein [Bartonella jaculi]|uniref:hypothetical protein n=1 Tax=Bartonella jaculi TaxID=686226 RepID=UPI0031EA9DC3
MALVLWHWCYQQECGCMLLDPWGTYQLIASLGGLYLCSTLRFTPLLGSCPDLVLGDLAF